MTPEFWTINDIKRTLMGISKIRVGDQFYMRNTKGEYYLKIVNIERGEADWELERIFNDGTHEIVEGGYDENKIYSIIIEYGYVKI
jgi:hypothetical protein